MVYEVSNGHVTADVSVMWIVICKGQTGGVTNMSRWMDG